VRPPDTGFVLAYLAIVIYIIWSTLVNFGLGEWLARCL